MNNRIKVFLKYAKYHPVTWSDYAYIYCVDIFENCNNCVLYNDVCNGQSNQEIDLIESDIEYLKEHFPEFFI